MKAQAPNKIYIERDRNGRFSMPYWSEDPYLGHFEKVEYIRKDALVEWASEHYTGLDISKHDMWDGGYNVAIKELIDKLNSM